MSRAWVPLCFRTKRVTGELWLLGCLFGFMGHIQPPVTLKKMANQHINECIIAAAKKKQKTSAHKSIILIGITSPQLLGAPASLGSSSDKCKAGVWIQLWPVIWQNTRITQPFVYTDLVINQRKAENGEKCIWAGRVGADEMMKYLSFLRTDYTKIPFSYQWPAFTLNCIDGRGEIL